MPKAEPPSFALQSYWQDRFTHDTSPFDWLIPADGLDKHIHRCLRYLSSSESRPRILHIGCGSSKLSLRLRKFVEDPFQVHNTDYSPAAIEIGSAWEKEFIAKLSDSQEHIGVSNSNAESDSKSPDQRCMQWSTVDLLSLASVKSLSAKTVAQYNLIIDKSTSDAIACGDDVEVSLPYGFRVDSDAGASAAQQKARVYPLHVLAVYLAALTSAGGRWLAVSYSSSRFPFVPPLPATKAEGLLERSVIEAGLPDPGWLWKLESKESIELLDVVQDVAVVDTGTERPETEKPKISHWLYILVRTETALNRD